MLVNESKLPAKYQVTSLDAHELATLTAEAMSGEIPAHGEANVAITLCAQALGRMTLTAHVQVGLHLRLRHTRTASHLQEPAVSQPSQLQHKHEWPQEAALDAP